MEFLGQEASQSGINTQSSHSPVLMVDSFERSKTLLDIFCNQAQSKENSIWLASSWKSLEGEGELIDGIKGSMPSESSCLFYFDERKQLWHTIENICQSLNDYGELWEDKNPVNDVKKQPELPNLGKQPEESMKVDANYNLDLTSLSESLVSVSKSYTSKDNQVKFPFSVDEPSEAGFCFDLSTDTRNDAASLWRSYELLTTRLSQELSEQLRLVMEPTIASKLQGDYKTGKRIDLKKVIQYIVSQYRKDKIWLRRTRPSKRDYQVVIAVDDSHSMSERHCGNFAIEALVTVCRAMSQLEMGNFAVTSFGQEGNVRVLHDFDQPFSPEAGIKEFTREGKDDKMKSSRKIN